MKSLKYCVNRQDKAGTNEEDKAVSRMGKQWNLFYSVVTVVGLNIRHVSGKLKFFKAKLIIPNPFYRCKKVLILLRQFKLTNKKRIKTAGFLFAFLVIFLCTRISLIIWNIFTTCFSFTFYIFIQFFYWKKMKLLLLFFMRSYFFCSSLQFEN